MRKITSSAIAAIRHLAWIALAVAGGALAQARLTEPDSTPASPIAPALERLDESLRQQTVAGNDAASHWISAELSPMDPVVQVRQYAAAAAAAPTELLYAASLARACVIRTQPPLQECDERDALAYFATRDPDNAVPWLLLAERARRRPPGSVPVIDNLERAAASKRFDDYAGRAPAIFYAKLAPIAPGPVVAALAADRYAAHAGELVSSTVESLCGRPTTDERTARACLRLAGLMVERAAGADDRAAGAAIAQLHAQTDSAKAAAASQSRTIALRRQACADAHRRLETLASRGAEAPADAASRRWIESRAKSDELSACEALAASL